MPSTVWTPELRAEVAQTLAAQNDALEKQRYNESLIRVLRDSRTGGMFATLDVARVSQLDSSSLDEELVRILREQTEKVSGMIPNLSSLVARFRTEVDLGIRILLWWFTMRLNLATPGETLQNLRYRNETKFSQPHTRGLLTLPDDMPTRTQRGFHLALSVFLPWMWNRLRDKAVEDRWGEDQETEQWWSAMEATDKAYRVASLANFLFFLVDGRYRSLADRVLKMRLVPARNESVRAVSFELINQQLLFEGFSEVLLVVLPLIDWSAFLRLFVKWRNLIKRFLLWIVPKRFSEAVFGPQAQETTTAEPGADGWKCVACGESPAVMPHQALPCKHVYCYFCLKTLTSRVSSASCLSCDKTIEGANRF